MVLVTKTSWYFFSSGRRTTSQLLSAVCAVLTTTFRSSTSCSKFLILSNSSFSLGFIVVKFCGETGIRTLGTLLGVRRFSKPLLSATQAPLQNKTGGLMSPRFERRLRDSNPGTCYSQQFSRLPHSTALPNLHFHKYKGNKNNLPINYFLKRSFTLSLIGIGLPSSSILTKVM